jgi:hypothetical protein
MIYDMRDDQYKALDADGRTAGYIAAIAGLLDTDQLPATASRINVCPECGDEMLTPDDYFNDHVIWVPDALDGSDELESGDHTVVIVGCEGYWVIDPAVAGIDSPNWSDWRADVLD